MTVKLVQAATVMPPSIGSSENIRDNYNSQSQELLDESDSGLLPTFKANPSPTITLICEPDLPLHYQPPCSTGGMKEKADAHHAGSTPHH